MSRMLVHRASLLAFVLCAGLCAARADQPAAPVAAAADVPVKQVVLFSSGVGYFEHFGTVKGDGSTELRFQTEQINDVLKSLVLQDLDGGRAGTVTYPSQEPIDRTLKSFQVDITSNPALEVMLNQLRGATLSVTTGGKQAKGTIVGVQKRQRSATDKEPASEVWLLNLKSGRTIRSIPMDDITDLAIEDPKLDAELDRALNALAQSRDQEKKPVTINFRGQGERRVRIGYVVETPVWKTSYRLILGDAGKDAANKKDAGGKLQGWAIVENQTDSDWNDVQLSLVSGRPISFIQQLYLPLYIPRPVVWPELYASLRPQTYKGGMSAQEVEKLRQAQAEGGPDFTEAPSFSLDQQATTQPRGGGGGGLFGGSGGGSGREKIDPAASVVAMASAGRLGELFEYTVGNVTLPRQRSAMLPIVTDPIDVERVSIVNREVLEEHPLTGVRVKNTTGKHLLQGPVTVLDAGAYAGDARINDIPPGQDRLLSYGVDLQVFVTCKDAPVVTTIQTGKIVKGVLSTLSKEVDSYTFTASNKSKVEKTLVFEVPTMGGDYKLIEPAQADETTNEVHRFNRAVGPGKSVRLKVVMETVTTDTLQIAQSQDQLAVYIANNSIPAAVREALSEAVRRQGEVMTITRELEERHGQVKSIAAEQERIRDNMKTVSEKTEYYQRLLKKLDEQETTLEGLQTDITQRQQKLDEQRKGLEKYLAELTIG